MWPAMWSAIFPNDGPGLENAILADELGVVMGMSQEMIAPMINSLQMTDTVKGMDLDTISISLGVPKYQHGYAISLKIPGISQVLGGILDATQK